MLVLFDGVWNPNPIAGTQPEPIPGVHNSQWVQSPGAELLGDPSRHAEDTGRRAAQAAVQIVPLASLGAMSQVRAAILRIAQA